MSIIYCDKHDRQWDSDKMSECPVCENEPTAQQTAKDKVCDEIRYIMRVYREQEAEGNVDTPGGLEHMGDVWRMFARWDRELNEQKS